MNTEKFKYDFLRYNRYHVLRPHALLLVTVLYYLKDLLILLVIAASAFKARGASSEVGALIAIASPRMIFSNIPALFLIFALLHRQPAAGKFPRFIWRNGRHFILAAAIINSVLLLFQEVPITSMSGKILIGFLILNIVTVIYVYRSEQVGDVFAEFPERPAEPPDDKA